jgi:hypothetical protein
MRALMPRLRVGGRAFFGAFLSISVVVMIV